MLMFAGLGNPGAEYAGNRHNAGFLALDEIAERHGFSPWKAKSGAAVAEGRLGGEKLLLAKPQSFMNKSGGPVGEISRFFKIPPAQVFVFYDEIDLVAGKVRVKRGGGHGGHNGLRDIIAKLGNQNNFYRLRLGIGHPGHSSLVTGYVLGRAPQAEREKLDASIDFTFDVLPEILAGDWTRAMQRLHSQKA